MLNDILNTKGPILIRASAGTGKTYTLTQKVIHLIVNEMMDVDQILAVTFTEFASAEMRDRIYSAINDALKSETDPRKAAHLERQRVRFYRNQISTFHGFCMNLIQSYPDVAGLETEIRVMDAFQEAQFNQQVRTQFYQKHKDHAPLVRMLMRYGQREVEAACNSLGDVSEARLQAMNGKTPDAWLGMMRTLHAEMLTNRDESYARLRAFAASNPGLLKAGVVLPEDFPLDYEAYFTQKGGLSLNKAVSKSADGEIKNEAVRMSTEMNATRDQILKLGAWLMNDEADLIRDLQNPDNQSLEADTISYHAMRDLSDVVLRWRLLFREERIKTGKLIFDDLIQIARTMIASNKDWVEQIRSKYRYIVVDEFQDTDAAQWDILSALMNGSTTDMLLVGDVKQAIYEFRGGNVSVMQRVARELPHEEFNLGQSWRSAKELVAGLNRIFRQILPAETDKLYEAIAQDLEHPGQVKNANTEKGTLAQYLLPDRFNDKDKRVAWPVGERSDAEARSLAHFMRAVRDGGKPEYEDIRQKMIAGEKAVGILLPSRKDQWKFEQCLRDAGLPYSSFSGVKFYETQIVWDALALIRFLADAYQDLSCAAAYRSPFVGFSDEALVLMRDVGAASRLYNAVRDWRETPHPHLSPADQLVLEHAVPWLETMRRRVKTHRLSDILTEAFFSRPYLVSVIDIEQSAANIHKLVRIVRDLERQGTGSLVDVEQFLTRQIEDAAREQEGVVADAGSIQFMTIHGAKGLEFPMVLLPGLGSGKGGDRGVTVRSPRDLPDDKTWVVPKGLNSEENDDYKGALYHRVRQQVKHREEAEQKRMFYVACTRARNHLVFWGSESVEKKGSLGRLIPDHLPFEPQIIQPEWLDSPCIRRLDASIPPIGDREAVQARLDSAHREVMRPSQTDSEDEPAIRNASPWRSVEARSAGDVIHKVLEHLDWSLSSRQLIVGLVTRCWPSSDPHPEDIERASHHVERSIWALRERFPDAKQVRREVAFEADVPDEGWVKGVIDLLIKDSAGEWHVVDYKTGDAEAQIEVYARQLQLYGKALDAISAGSIRIRKENLLLLSTERGIFLLGG